MSEIGGWLRDLAQTARVRLAMSSHARLDPEPRNRLDTARAYRADLDGLRAVAVGLVILTHARWPWVNNGGDAGVTAFFVLSGYLITNLLLGQLETRGSDDIIGFYRRRVVRLSTALLGLLAFTLMLGVIVGLTTDWRLGLLSCLVYVSNWVQVAGFNIDPLGHTWSLAIEEQFYLVWPALIVLLRGRILYVALAGIIGGTVIRFVATGPLEYFSTITRADAILVGCLLALTAIELPRWTGAVALATLVGIAAINADHDLTIGIAMIATAIVIVARVEVLGFLAPIGRRAYSLYLWNWPMTLLFGSMGPLAPLLTVLAAEVSYRLLEAPVMHRGGRSVANPTRSTWSLLRWSRARPSA
jgi:peptidoglycan/LPS O-acetylase OafA/YrhL